MPYRLFLLVIACAGIAIAASSETENPWLMRWRSCADYVSGYAFRYPYEYVIPDQYAAELIRERPGHGAVMREITVNGKRVMVMEEANAGPEGVDVKAFSFAAGSLPSGVSATPEAVGNLMANDPRLALAPAHRALTWTPFDYYQRVDERPQAEAKWALPRLVAMVGAGTGACGLVVKHGDRFSGVILTGGLTAGDNQRILDSFEILVPKGKEPQSWREGQGRKGFVITSAGRPLKAGPSGPRDWQDGWELETRHYHVTTHVSPAKLVEYGALLEALYAVYSKTYDPETTPPFKLEVHIFNSQGDFMEAAAAMGTPISSRVGGFFMPGFLSIWAFQQTDAAGFPAEATVDKILAHECSHQFLHVTCNGSEHVPTWMNEGLAVYFENGRFERGSGQFVLQSPKGRIQILQQLYAQGKRTLWPLDKYLGHYGHISAEQYGEVYAMVHFWIFGAQGGTERFKTYWTALKAGENGSDAFDRVFMADLKKAHGSKAQAVAVWETMLMDYVKRLK